MKKGRLSDDPRQRADAAAVTRFDCAVQKLRSFHSEGYEGYVNEHMRIAALSDPERQAAETSLHQHVPASYPAIAQVDWKMVRASKHYELVDIIEFERALDELIQTYRPEGWWEADYAALYTARLGSQRNPGP